MDPTALSLLSTKQQKELILKLLLAIVLPNKFGPEPRRIDFFVNGINNDEKDCQDSAQLLSAKLNVPVIPLHIPSHGSAASDAISVALDAGYLDTIVEVLTPYIPEAKRSGEAFHQLAMISALQIAPWVCFFIFLAQAGHTIHLHCHSGGCALLRLLNGVPMECRSKFKLWTYGGAHVTVEAGFTIRRFYFEGDPVPIGTSFLVTTTAQVLQNRGVQSELEGGKPAATPPPLNPRDTQVNLPHPGGSDHHGFAVYMKAIALEDYSCEK